MYEFIDSNLMNLIDGIAGSIHPLLGSFTGIAKSLAAILTLIYFGSEAYKIMAGEKTFEIMPLLRPFGILLIILCWGNFLGALDAPLNAIHGAGKQMYLNKMTTIDNLNKTRTSLQDSIMDQVTRKQEEVRAAQANEDRSWWQKIGADVSGLWERIQGLGLWLVAQVRQFMFNWMETIVQIIWQAMVYLMLFLRLVFKGVLGIIGPLSLALSILPMFRTTFSRWLSKYITVNLYGCITYIMLALSAAIIQYAIETDVQVLRQANADDTALAMQTVFNTGYINGFMPAMIMAILALFQVPKLAEWIVESGSNAAVSGFGGKAAGMASAAISGGATAAVAVARSGNNNNGNNGGGGYAGGANNGGGNNGGGGYAGGANNGGGGKNSTNSNNNG